MQKGHEYLLTLNPAPLIKPKDGDQATIFDWSGGNSFQVITIVSSSAPWPDGSGHVHVRAIVTNSYGPANLAGSRLRYRDGSGGQESREITQLTPL